MSTLVATNTEYTNTLCTPLEAVLRPIQGGGEDPRFSDDFLWVRQEMDKLQGNDYGQIFQCCCRLLAEQAKDLRVGGYLILAGLGTGGVEGLIETAEAYRRLLSVHCEICHPQRDNARINALRWLNNPRLEAMARKAVARASSEQLSNLRTIVDDINTLIHACFAEDAPTWGIGRWLKIPEKSVPDLQEVAKQTMAIPSPAPAAVKSCGVTSERDLFQMTRSISEFLWEKGQWLQAVAFTRALRWGGLSRPSAEQGRTRVPLLRAGAVAELGKAKSDDDPAAMLHLCEALFLESGGQFWFDLQHQAWRAAEQLGKKELATFIADQVGALVKRLPGLETLSFEDGSPFANTATRTWIQELISEEGVALPAAEPDDWDEQLNERLERARELVGRKKLNDALRLLCDLSADSEIRRLRLKLAQAGLCLMGERPDVALPLLEILQAEVDKNRVALWDKALALEVWRLSLEAVQLAQQQAAGHAREELEIREVHLRNLICCTDPAAAVGWL